MEQEKKTAPIVLFVYNRPDHVEKTLKALSENELASESDLFIYADGPKENATEDQLKKIKKTREICKQYTGFKSIILYESEKNKGLAQNIIEGVTAKVNEYGKVIVLEDDIVTGKYFLTYMNEALERYQNNHEVYAISGWYYPIEDDKNEAFLLPNFNCWGWATWKDRWSTYKKDCKYYKEKFNKEMIKHFNLENRFEYWPQILDNEKGICNTWFIFWYAGAFLKNGLCLFPTKSLVNNSGCDGTGENCSVSYFAQNNSINTKIDVFPTELLVDENRKEKLINYLDEINKKFWFRKTMRMFLRKINLYGFARKIYKKLK